VQAPVTTIKAEEPWAILIIEKHKVSLLINIGASISAISFFLDPGPLRNLFHSASSLLLGRFPLLSLFFNCPRNPYSSARAKPSI
jgi:hypothetical protein